jgi:hypothetical protein
MRKLRFRPPAAKKKYSHYLLKKDKTVVPATDNQVALLKVTAAQEKMVEMLVAEMQRPKAAEALAKRKYYAAEGEVVRAET